MIPQQVMSRSFQSIGVDMKHFIQQDAKCLYTFASISAVKKNLPMDVRRNLAVELRDAENPQLLTQRDFITSLDVVL